MVSNTLGMRLRADQAPGEESASLECVLEAVLARLCATAAMYEGILLLDDLVR